MHTLHLFGLLLFVTLIRQGTSVYVAGLQNRDKVDWAQLMHSAHAPHQDDRACVFPTFAHQRPEENPAQQIYPSGTLEAGQWLFYAGRYHEAIARLQTVRASSPKRALAHDFIAASYIGLAQGQQASQYVRDDTLAWQAFASVWRCLFAGQAERSAALYDFALASKPEIWHGWRMGDKPIFWTYWAAAQVADQRGDQPARLHWLEQAWADYPAAAATNDWLGEFYEQAGNLRVALTYYQRALLADPNGEPNLYLAMARVNLRLGQSARAVAALKTLLTKIESTSPWLLEQSAALVQPYADPALCAGMRDVFAPKSPASPARADLVAMILQACAKN